MMALGSGVIDIPAIVAASRGTAEWLIVELDECATDMSEAVRGSFSYLANAVNGTASTCSPNGYR